jgi:hypothetical protein
LKVAATAFGVVAVKLGQILSKQPFVKDPELKKVLEHLSDKVEAMDKRYLLSALLFDHSLEWARNTIAWVGKLLGSASIKQGYVVKLVNGAVLALKYIRPLAHYEVKENMTIFRTVMGRLRGKIAVLDQVSDELVDQVDSAVTRELDMPQEIAAQKALYRFSDGDSLDGWRTQVARVDSEVQGAQFFADEFINGFHPKQAAIDRLKAEGKWHSIARLAFYTILKQVLVKGQYHADLHPGNIMLIEELKQLFLLDFGNNARLSWLNRLRFIGMLVGLRFGWGGMTVSMLSVMQQSGKLSVPLRDELSGIAGNRSLPIDARIRDIKARLEKVGIVFKGEFEVVFKVFATIQYITESLTQRDMDEIAARVLVQKLFYPITYFFGLFHRRSWIGAVKTTKPTAVKSAKVVSVKGNGKPPLGPSTGPSGSRRSFVAGTAGRIAAGFLLTAVLVRLLYSVATGDLSSMQGGDELTQAQRILHAGGDVLTGVIGLGMFFDWMMLHFQKYARETADNAALLQKTIPSIAKAVADTPDGQETYMPTEIPRDNPEVQEIRHSLFSSQA